jgi:hypothetical protein
LHSLRMQAAAICLSPPPPGRRLHESAGRQRHAASSCRPVAPSGALRNAHSHRALTA